LGTDQAGLGGGRGRHLFGAHGKLHALLAEGEDAEFRQAVRWGNWKAIRMSKGQALELYDLKADPKESHNIAAQNPTVIAQFEAYLAQAREPSVEYP
jgi:arylsulfatase A-like enzyme